MYSLITYLRSRGVQSIVSFEVRIFPCEENSFSAESTLLSKFELHLAIR